MRIADAAMAHVETWRPYTAAYVGMVGLAGAGIAGVSELSRLVVAWAVPTLAWVAGLYGGDYFDRELDALEKPTRPIPSGRLSAGTALTLMWVCAGVGALTSILVNPWTVVVAAVAMALGLAYSMALKKVGLLGNLTRGAMMSLVVIFGAMSSGGPPTVAVIAPALAVFCHDVASNVVGTIRDVKGDAEGGYRTLAVIHGPEAAAWIAGGFYGAALAAAAWAIAPQATASIAFGGLLVAAALGGATGGVLNSSLARVDALRAHTLLLQSRILMASAFLVAWFGAAFGITAAVLASGFTLITERTLRARHESMAQRGDPPLGVEEVEQYIDDQITRLMELPRPPRTLSTWNRSICVSLSDLGLHLGLRVGEGRIVRDEALLDSPDALRITTTTATFAAIFIDRTSNPRRALLTHQLRFAGTAADMVHANALFSEFLRADTRGTEPRRPTTTSPREAHIPTPAHLPDQIVIADTTLRDGEQTPGVAFDEDTKVDIAQALDKAGVGLIEIGFPAVSAEEAATVRAISSLGLSAQTQAIARPVPADVEAALASGVDSIAIFVGTSDVHIRHKLRTTPAEVERQVRAAVAQAATGGAAVVFAAEDATRSDPDVLLRMFDAAATAGATALGIADTAGVAHPRAFEALVRRVATAIPLPIGVHCHNDLGLAVANSLAGIAGGASGLQGSVIGIGERAGNAALEELVLALEIAHDIRTGIDLLLLPALARKVAAAARLPIPVNKPVVGSHMFTHESGLHVDGIVREPACYEPYPPERIGATRRIVLGKHSGRSCIRTVLGQAGRVHPDPDITTLLNIVKHRGSAGESVSPEELAELADSLRLSQKGRDE